MDNNKKKKKNYYKYHNNHYNKNNHSNKQFYYYKNKKKKQKQNIVVNEEQTNQNVNVLLENEEEQKVQVEEQKVQVEEQREVLQNVQINEQKEIQQEVQLEEQQRPIQQVIKEKSVDYEELEFRPIKKGEQSEYPSKLGFFKYALGFLILVAIVFGVSYSFFNYRQEDTRQGDIASGEVYVRLQEETVALTLNKMYPRTAEEARSRNDNYIDFTIKAKNTSETKEINYILNITNGEEVQNKVRINPQYLMIDLQEKVGNEYQYIKNAVALSSFSFNDIVPVNTTNEITKEYRLRVWVSDGIIISDTETNKTYTQAEFANLYANLHVEINSVDQPRTIPGSEKVLSAIEAKQNAQTNSCNPIWVDDNGTANDNTDDITYFSGTNECVDMNYVWYSGKLWRITAIYPDGAMKLATENNITSIAFNESSVNFYTDANTTSYMYQWLNEDFYDTLYNANNVIDTSKQWNATMPADTTISTKPLETNMVTANVGLLNNYEFYNSYRCISSATCTGTSYSTGYLNIGYYWWLLNPYSASYTRSVSNLGYSGNGVSTSTNGCRPSIYLKSGLEFTGDGTSSNPYKIVGDKDVGSINELINTRLSGEYVKLKNGDNEQLFRIIGVEDNKTKIIAMDYAENGNTRKFATSSSDIKWGSGTTTDADTWYTYLNTPTTGYLATLKNTYGELFDSGLYYFGTSGYNYKLSVCANTTSGNIKVCDKTSDKGTFDIGLTRYGEMFAAQQAEGHSNSAYMWLMNGSFASKVWSLSNFGNANYKDPTSMYVVRPTVHLKSTIKILSGSGTETDPYVVGL